MDDDTGLELSLGLSCGGSSGKAKGNNNTTNNAGSSSENHRVEGGDRSAKVIDDFKNFLHPTSQRPSEPSSGSQRSDSNQQPPQNFFNDLSKAPTNDGEASTKPLWVEDETRKETGSKRKFGFSGMNDEKKKEKDSSSSHVVDLHEKKTKASHVSTATDEGSTAENEDVADSEVGGGGGGSSSNLAKDVTRPNADTNIVDSLACQRKSSNHGGSSAEEFTIRNMSSYTVPFTAHPQNVATSLPYSAKESGQHAAATSLMQPAASPGNLPVMFGYSPVQLPMLDKDGASGIVALSQSPFAGRGPSNSATAKGEGKQPVAEEGSSEDASERPTGENNNNNSNAAFSFDFSAIKPGMAADVKFGGSGARPNLPWVSTTGSGPHGRTISGVTYRYNANQIKIVCACHGSHMSPEEFVRHASEEYVSPESSIGMTAASAHT